MEAKVRWGILSTAKIGVQKVIPAMQNGKLISVDAIASRNLQKAKEVAELLSISKSYGSYEELLQDPDIDAIYNPLPNHMHVPWTIRALEAGKHVLCEKPIGMDAQEAQLLLEATQKYPHLKVMEAFMYRFHPQWQKVREFVQTGEIGEVATINSFFSYYNIAPDNIRNQADIGGGALMDIGCYCISFPRFIFNEEPEQLVADMDFDPLMKTDRLSSAILKFPKGKTSTFTCSTQLMPYQRAIIFGDKGKIEVEIPVNAPPTETVKITLETKESKQVFAFEPIDQYTLQGEAFSKAIIENTEVPTPLTDAVNNMKVIDAIIKSSLNGQWITI
ncbi:Gfo/Idh/MocA family oxidoreductase [uncultured Draconibacterium sp.]|uniref:Gfo/Idh/MocA family protein n=1 Tax=uncultured Draconibacterium sp. TaxID=1573823 RepID=UPI003217D2FA